MKNEVAEILTLICGFKHDVEPEGQIAVQFNENLKAQLGSTP